MPEIIIYLLKVSAGLGIILLPYYFLFRNDPNLIIKRFYLLTGLAAAWVFPLIAFRRPGLFVDLTPTVFMDFNEAEVHPINLVNSGLNPGITINWIQVLIITYLIGLIFMFLKNIFIILKWNHTWRKTRNDEGVAFIQNDQVFTMFTRIFIPGSLKDKQDLDNVLLHEKAHILQFHFIDLMIMEFTLLLTWFNPFSWLISRMIKENHEHLADRQVLSAGINPARYRAQLLNHTLGVNVFRLGNQFNHSLTLKRFNMMKKPRKSPMGIIKIALLIPIVLVTLGLTTGMTPQQKTIKGKVVLADSGEPATGAAVIIKGTTYGTVADEEGLFLLEVEGDPEIVISYVGYSNMITQASKITKKPLKLEQKVFKMDLESVPINVAKEGENAISIKIADDSGKQPVFVLEEEVMSTPMEAKSLNDGETTHQSGDEVFYIVEDMPMFPGGKSALKTYIYSNLEFPESAKKKRKNGEVLVQFLVNTSGKLEDIKVVQSSYEGFNKSALNIFKNMPDWNPGKQRGKPVKVQVVVPVRFNAGKE